MRFDGEGRGGEVSGADDGMEGGCLPDSMVEEREVGNGMQVEER